METIFLKKITITALLGFLIPVIAFAQNPGIPHQFFGAVHFASGTTPNGLQVQAKIYGVAVGSSVTANGNYGYSPNLLFITDNQNANAGKTIEFYVSGIKAKETAVFVNGDSTNLDLTVPGAIGSITKQEGVAIENEIAAVTPTSPMNITIGDNLTITISSTTNTSALIEKIEKLSSGSVAVFSGKNFLNAYDIKISGENLSISVTMKYNDAGIDEDTIAPYWFNGTSWVAITLPAPFINKTANTITFTIFSGQTVYGIFGSALSSPPPAQPPAGGTTGSSSGTSDTTAPSISDIKVTAGSDTATITWKTNESSLTWLVYGKTTAYGKEVKTATYAASHAATLEDLSSETVYHYQIKSKDAGGNTGTESDKTFTTLAKGEKIIGDINNDNKVDKYDFALMMSAWGKTGVNSSDLNGDNKVDKYDFALLMLNWSTI